jgi:predicted nucleotidyltransferase
MEEGFAMGKKVEKTNTTSKVVDPQAAIFKELFGERTAPICVLGQEKLIDEIVNVLVKNGDNQYAAIEGIRSLLGNYYKLTAMDGMALWGFARTMKDEMLGVKLMLIAATMLRRKAKSVRGDYRNGNDLDKLMVLNGATLGTAREAIALFKTLPEFDARHPVYGALKGIIFGINDVEILIEDTSQDRLMIRKLDKANLEVEAEKARRIEEIKRRAQLEIDGVTREAERITAANDKTAGEIDGSITRAIHTEKHGDACPCKACRVALLKKEADEAAAGELSRFYEKRSRTGINGVNSCKCGDSCKCKSASANDLRLANLSRKDSGDDDSALDQQLEDFFYEYCDRDTAEELTILILKTSHEMKKATLAALKGPSGEIIKTVMDGSGVGGSVLEIMNAIISVITTELGDNRELSVRPIMVAGSQKDAEAMLSKIIGRDVRIVFKQ